MGAVDLNYYEGIAREMLGKFGRVAHFTPHGPSIGNYHEEVVREVIEGLLSPRIGVYTGFAYSGPSRVSSQGDILLVDHNDPAPFLFKQGRFVVVHPRALLCVVEVKSALCKRSFIDAVRNIASFAELGMALPKKSVPFGLIFAHSGTRLTPRTLDQWYREIDVPDEIERYPSLIYSLTHGMLQLRNDKAEDWGHYNVGPMGSKGLEDKCLSVLLATLRKIVELRSGLVANPFELANIAGLCWSRQYLRYGRGCVDPGDDGE